MSNFNPFSPKQSSETVSSGGDNLPVGLTAADVEALTHYPAIGRLFEKQDFSALTDMKRRLNETFQNLERVVLRGSTNDARRAQTAVTAVQTALDFLQMLEEMQANGGRK